MGNAIRVTTVYKDWMVQNGIRKGLVSGQQSALSVTNQLGTGTMTTTSNPIREKEM
jgi:hypothetical protein